MSLVCGNGGLSLCISKAFHRTSRQKAAKQTKAAQDIPQQPARHMSPMETGRGHKQREASSHDHLNNSSEIIPSDADTTVIGRHLWKRASADASQQPVEFGGKEAPATKQPAPGLVFSSRCTSPSCMKDFSASLHPENSPRCSG